MRWVLGLAKCLGRILPVSLGQGLQQQLALLGVDGLFWHLPLLQPTQPIAVNKHSGGDEAIGGVFGLERFQWSLQHLVQTTNIFEGLHEVIIAAAVEPTEKRERNVEVALVMSPQKEQPILSHRERLEGARSDRGVRLARLVNLEILTRRDESQANLLHVFLSIKD